MSHHVLTTVAVAVLSFSVLGCFSVLGPPVQAQDNPPDPLDDLLDDLFARAFPPEAQELADLHDRAFAGEAQAQYAIGLRYASGRGVPQDDAEAVAWYRLAAEQGLARAQNNLGWMYASGRGVPQDDVTAHMWLNVAAATGHEQARKNRDSVAANMTREQIAEAQARARDWVNR